MNPREIAERLFEEHGHCAHVAQHHELGKRKYIDAHDAEGLKKFKQREQEKSIDLYQRSVETALKLDLPLETFYDLYFSKDSYKSNNLISGLRPESAIAIVNYRGYSIKPTACTDELCKLEVTVAGVTATFTLTQEEAFEFPLVQESLKDPESKWVRNPREALLNEAVKMIIKAQFLRVFTPKSKAVQNNPSASNKDLAKYILKDQIYNIEDAAFDAIDFLKASKELLKTASERDQRAILKQVKEKGEEIKKTCLQMLAQGLEICERLNIPKDQYFGVSAKAELLELFTISNVKQKWFIDILYARGYVLLVEKMNRHMCRIRLEVDGDQFTEEMTFNDIKDKPDIRRHLDSSGNLLSSDHFICQRIELKLFFELIKSIVKKYYRAQFLLPERKPRKQPSRFNLDLETLLYGDDNTNKQEDSAPSETPVLDEIDLETLEESLIEKVANEAMNFALDDDEPETPKAPTAEEKAQFRSMIDVQRTRLKKIFERE